VRTVERDIGALQQAGTPIYAEAGRTGGYCLDKARTLPPVNLTPGEAVAMACALQRMSGTPFDGDAGSALRKLVAAMQVTDAAAAASLASRIHVVTRRNRAAPVPRVVGDAVASGRVLRILYGDREGAVTERAIEPLGFIDGFDQWYLLAWCRLREGVRAFRTDRIARATVSAEIPEPRTLRDEDLDIPPHLLKALELTPAAG
ncbi:WYL domain-containing protein, partial [Actinoplanes sp. NPDC051633]|uniref:helix-turn-helix transcriptional regulator n=1 Tax=Actinoplanes sp. NPDC051633 TaxID=3155670 RepID=UPI00343E0744